jgi:hypothetical protein
MAWETSVEETSLDADDVLGEAQFFSGLNCSQPMHLFLVDLRTEGGGFALMEAV